MQALTPLLTVEILADLSKASKNRTPDRAVSDLAGKFGGSGPVVMMDYVRLCRSELLGRQVPMTGQIIPAEFKSSRDGTAIMIDLHALNHAILKWASGKFDETDRELAVEWRRVTRAFSFDGVKRRLHERRIAIPEPATDSTEALFAAVDTVLNGPGLQQEWIEWMVPQLRLSPPEVGGALFAWRVAGRPLLREHAPYVHHCMRAQLALACAVVHKLVKWQSTHAIDCQYLFYMPFCRVFASNDHLHELLAPGLLRSYQDFVDGRSLKASLKAQTGFWDSLDGVKRSRLSAILGFYPPPVPPPLVTDLWRKSGGSWHLPMRRPEGMEEAEYRAAIDEATQLVGHPPVT